MQARAFLGRREAGADRAELQRTLQEIHADIFSQIDQEVRLPRRYYFAAHV